MHSERPAPGWEDLWDVHQRLLSDLTQAYREMIEHVGPVQQQVLAKRYQSQCEPIIRALAQIPTADGPPEPTGAG